MRWPNDSCYGPAFDSAHCRGHINTGRRKQAIVCGAITLDDDDDDDAIAAAQLQHGSTAYALKQQSGKNRRVDLIIPTAVQTIEIAIFPAG